VVGIVGNTRIGGPESRLRPEAYIPLSHAGLQSGYLLVRSRVPRSVLSRSIVDIAGAVSPTSTLGTVSSLDDVFSRLVAERRLSLLLFGLFGVLALAIASVGVYGVLAYLVQQRTKEIGVRMALGATRARIVHSVLGRSAAVVGVGLVLGLMMAWMLARLVAGFLFEVPPHDLIVYASVSIVLGVTGLLAALVPARRAASVDPLVALRID
jgi:ABC-type antimicrobial peptide transport system permease subunit